MRPGGLSAQACVNVAISAYFLIESKHKFANDVNWSLFPKGNFMALSAISSGLSGLQSNQKALDAEARNIANLNTQNVQTQPGVAQGSSSSGNGVSLSAAGRSLAAAEGLSGAGADAATSMTNSLVYKAGFQASAKVVQAADERLGTLIDIKA